MDTSNILRFVTEWTANNSESWFTSHAEEFLQIKADLGRLAVQLNLGIRAFDPNIMLLRPKDMLRDIFPTHPTLQIHIAPEGMRPIPVGYFLCIRPGNRSFLSGGLYSSMFGTASDMVRRYIIKDPLAWSALLDEPSFRERFVVLGTPLRKFPAGYDPKHPHAKYLQQNNWYVRYPIQDATLMIPDMLESVALETFAAMCPFIKYLNRAMKGFRMRA